jgi:hypothetical protein
MSSRFLPRASSGFEIGHHPDLKSGIMIHPDLRKVIPSPLSSPRRRHKFFDVPHAFPADIHFCLEVGDHPF